MAPGSGVSLHASKVVRSISLTSCLDKSRLSLLLIAAQSTQVSGKSHAELLSTSITVPLPRGRIETNNGTCPQSKSCLLCPLHVQWLIHRIEKALNRYGTFTFRPRRADIQEFYSSVFGYRLHTPYYAELYACAKGCLDETHVFRKVMKSIDCKVAVTGRKDASEIILTPSAINSFQVSKTPVIIAPPFPFVPLFHYSLTAASLHSTASCSPIAERMVTSVSTC